MTRKISYSYRNKKSEKKNVASYHEPRRQRDSWKQINGKYSTEKSVTLKFESMMNYNFTTQVQNSNKIQNVYSSTYLQRKWLFYVLLFFKLPSLTG